MDREIPKIQQQKEKSKQITKWVLIFLIGIAIVFGAISILQTSLTRSEITISKVDTGTIDISINASGKVIPAFEETINSPIDSRIVAVYRKGGDSVEAGTSIMQLDLQSVETDYHKMVDEEQMLRLQLERMRVSNRIKLSEMEMNLKVARMELDRKAVELRNERYLDSLGAGTSDKVLQAELNYQVGCLQLEEDEQSYQNEKELAASDLKLKELEWNIFQKSLAEMKRTLDEAQIHSPRKAILTYVNNEIGSRVAKGERIAVVSDLSHFKIEAEIADAYGDRIAVGNHATIKIGTDILSGNISEITPLSKNGIISFNIQLDEDNHKRLRSGLRTDIYVMEAIREDALRIENGPFYSGAGEYELFVSDGDQWTKRKIQLGSCNYQYIEVLSGLYVREEVIISDMSEFENKSRIKIK